MATVLFNVRVDETMMEAIEAAAEDAGLKKSTWAREVLGAVALGGVTLEQLAALVEGDVSPHPKRMIPLQGRIGRRENLVRKCTHPPTAWQELPFTTVCKVCGDVLRRLG